MSGKLLPSVFRGYLEQIKAAHKARKQSESSYREYFRSSYGGYTSGSYSFSSVSTYTEDESETLNQFYRVLAKKFQPCLDLVNGKVRWRRGFLELGNLRLDGLHLFANVGHYSGRQGPVTRFFISVSTSPCFACMRFWRERYPHLSEAAGNWYKFALTMHSCWH